MHLRLTLLALAAWLACGCWTTTIITPARSEDTGSMGYGTQVDTFNAGLSASSISGTGLTSHSPTEPDAAGAYDSFWQIHHQNSVRYCVKQTDGFVSCAEAEFPGEKPAAESVLYFGPDTDATDEEPLPASYFRGRAVWLGWQLQLFRCAIEETKPVCKAAKL